MGPTQFIPSTWQQYRGKVISIGGGTGNPWNAYDAIFATALLLSANGGSGGNASNERTAACKYYSGGGCSRAGAAPYGNSVLRHAAGFQDDIELLRDAN
jgi:membrane-bound lytic murein transglycosylase B